ncbi:MAG: DUF4440 domain-containing protein [Gemmatimonadota bacterium]
MRWILIVGAGIAVLAALVWGVGALLPEEHLASTRAAYGQPPDSVFGAIAEVEAHPSWRAEVEAVEILSDDPLRWREAGEYGAIIFLAETVAPPSLFVARIDDPGQPFGGRWIWRVEPADDDGGGGSVVTITEQGEIYSPLFRFFARFVFGYHGTQEAYLRALGERFGEATAVERLEAVETGAAPPATERISNSTPIPTAARRRTDPKNIATRERSMARITGIGGIFFKADDPDALASWYGEHLGVPVGDGTWARFRWLPEHDRTRVASTVWSLFDRSGDYFRSESASFMVNYRVDDLDAMLDRLRAEGVEVDDRLEEYPYGRFGWATDPEGNRIELWEPVDPPAEEHAGGAGAARRAAAEAEDGGAAGAVTAATAEVRRAQEAMIAAELAGDAAALDTMIADDFHGVDAADGALTKATVLEGYRAGTVSLRSHEIDDVEVRVFGETAVVTGRARIRGRAAGSEFDSRLRYMDVWVRGPDRWLLAAAHLAPAEETP